MPKVFIAQSFEQFPSGYPGHFIINSWPLWASPLGTKENKISKFRWDVIHNNIIILWPGLWFNKLVYGRWDSILSLVFSLDNPLVKA